MSTPGPRHKDQQWLRGVRSDLDSDRSDWIAPTTGKGLSKLNALGGYLDTILTELGHPPLPHVCPECGLEHTRPPR